MAYSLGSRSRQELVGVHPDLIRVVEKAIEITTQDFSVHDGIRSQAEQQELVNRGVSKTLNSRHITGHAVDLVPYINGKLRWEWPPIYKIAEAMHAAAQLCDVPLRWGGAWDIDFTSAGDHPEAMVQAYSERRRAAGKSAFLDGPHFELPSARYPA
ncbi:M15 family metallopeptidase [Halioxenophilus sp. WMMB6]|uniref:M15 family metallopeptidase n=1 Tax=Halioxenophilus sp. WMMB6 TaxID=3073815 RepID=UPI00295F2965|nr:M15 family metallopeptidase [Halioxenophilus sp. WMMB6]